MEIPPTEQKLRPNRQCKMCCSHADENKKKKRRETRYYCEDCNAELCLSPCFKRYHKRVKYWRHYNDCDICGLHEVLYCIYIF